MNDSLAVRGVVATRPRHLRPDSGAPITSFRLVTTGRGAEFNWYTVTAFHELAVSAAACVARGDPLVVTGRLHLREWEGEPVGVTAEIEAEGLGHDLAWGRSAFTRSTAEWPLSGDGQDPGQRPAGGL